MTKIPKRRPRDPKSTREVILEAALSRLAVDGPEGVSLSEVAHLAGVNRGTAYQHFKTRENLIKATTDWVSDKLFRAVFGDPETLGVRQVEHVNIMDMTERLASFAMDNPEHCRVWLMQVLSLSDPTSDPFWKEYEGSIARFAKTNLAQDNVDSEVLSVITLSGAVLWPVWARARTKTNKGLRQKAGRFVRECIRFSMYGSLRPDQFPQLAERLKDGQGDVAKVKE